MHYSRRSSILISASAALVMLLSGGCFAGLLDSLGDKIPSVGGFMEEKPAITTSLKNAVTEVPFLDDFNPTVFAPMTRLPRGPNNGFLIERPGLFEFNAQSYCLHAGTYGPTKGDGYLYAPLAGPRAEVIRRIAQQSVVHPEIEQQDIQTLIWAILARTKLSEMSPKMQTVAAELLSEKDVSSLEGGALGAISDAVMERVMGKMSDAMRPIFEAESRLRNMLTTTNSSFEELEQVAVLVGDPEPGEGSREVPEGRWSYHPDGYFIRYFPSDYSETLIQMYVPEAFKVERDSKNRIAAISDALGNRIETAYDDQIEPVAVSGDSGARAYAFRSIRFVNVRYIGPDFTQTKESKWENVGWTFVGIPSGKGKVQSPPERFSGMADRYSGAKALGSQVGDLVKNADKLSGRKGEKASGPANDDLVDLGHYAVALKSALASGLEGKEPWVAEQGFMAQKAWQSRLCDLAGGSMTMAQIGTRVASTSLMGILAIGQDDGPCDNPPPKPENPKELDPSASAATPGNTGKQRLLPSGAPADPNQPNPDCKPMSNRMNELQKIYDAFKNNMPNQGEDGDQYYNRITHILGYDESKGGVSPMGTDPNSCTIIPNESLYTNEPAISRASDCAHEKSHQSRCRWARDNAAGGYPSWMMDANNYRKDEMDAYKAGMDAMKAWQAENGCQ